MTGTTHRCLFSFVLLALLASCPSASFAQVPAKDAAAPPDTLVLSNGDEIHGTFVSETGGKVSFHSDPLGDLSIAWSNIKELHTGTKLVVLDRNVTSHSKRAADNAPRGTLEVANDMVTVHPDSNATIAPIPTANAEYIVDLPTFDKQVNHEPGFFTGWNGSATAGATVVKATQDQYTVSGELGLVRTVPGVAWLDTRNRTSLDFSGSYGKITEPAYLSSTGPVAASYVKTSIYHLDAERDEYFSPRYFALAQTAFDHNFAQDLSLQQVYGGGIGWTALKKPTQEVDLKATLQYEKQTFLTGVAGSNQNLIGSTIAANYLLKLKLLTLTQEMAFVPAFNNPHAYSANETDSLTFPTWKNLGFSVGTLDSYLNDPPASQPPTLRNSFQFTMGLSYAFKSKY